jgi:hypothetical protein
VDVVDADADADTDTDADDAAAQLENQMDSWTG